MSDQQNDLPKGLRVYKPNERAPMFIKANMLINKAEFIQWLNEQHGDTVKLDVLESQGGKYYTKINSYVKPVENASQQVEVHQAEVVQPQNPNYKQDQDQLPF